MTACPPLSARKATVIGDAAQRLHAGLEALSMAADDAHNGQMEAVQVLWFCKALKLDAMVCLRATDPNETDEQLEGLAR